MIKDTKTVIVAVVAIVAVVVVTLMADDAMAVLTPILTFLAGLFVPRPGSGSTPPTAAILVLAILPWSISCSGGDVVTDPIYSGHLEVTAGDELELNAEASVEYGIASGRVTSDLSVTEHEVYTTTTLALSILGQIGAEVVLACEAREGVCEVCLLAGKLPPVCHQFEVGDEQ